MRSSQWLLLWSMLCTILGRLEKLDGHPHDATVSYVISMICLVLAIVYWFFDLRAEKKEKSPDVYALALREEMMENLSEHFKEIRTGDSISIHEKDGRKLLIFKA